MLKTNFSNALQLHAVPLSRIKQFHEASTATLMRTIIIKIDTQSVPSNVKSEILEMIAGYGRDLSYLYALLEQREFRRYCCGQRFMSPRAYVWVKKYSLCTGTPDFRANERDIRPNKST